MSFYLFIYLFIFFFCYAKKTKYIPIAAYIQNDLNIGKICKNGEKETTNNANNISKADYIPLSFWLVSRQIIRKVKVNHRHGYS